LLEFNQEVYAHVPLCMVFDKAEFKIIVKLNIFRSPQNKLFTNENFVEARMTKCRYIRGYFEALSTRLNFDRQFAGPLERQM